MATQFSVEEGRKWQAPFFTIWTGQMLSLLGSQLVQFALIWYLTEQTGSAKVLATASLVGLLPGVFLGPLIGTLVDRWNRRRILIVADTLIALATVILAVMFALGSIQLWHIYMMMFFRAVGGSFHHSAMGSSTSLMVPKEHLTRIQGINQTLNGGLNLISAPLGALLLQVLPMQGILAIDVVSALFAIVPLFFIAIPQPERTESGESQKTSVMQDLQAGFRYVLAWPGLLIILAMAMTINLLLHPASSLMPLLVTKHFAGGVGELAKLEVAFGIGVIIGGLGLGVWGGFKNRAATSMFGLVGLGIGFLILGMAPASMFIVALGGSVFAGIMIPITNGAIGAILQGSVNPDMQGRVFTLVSSAAMAASPIGLIMAAPIAVTFGIQSWYWFGGAVCALMGAGGFFIPALMNLEKDAQKQNDALQLEAQQQAGAQDGLLIEIETA
ncbi:MAG: MFS transporter [Anaerolineae bacterium]|nr:MFS transporter [Anaerolineae bacterium]